MPLTAEQCDFLNAAIHGDAETVRALLAAGVEVNTPDPRSLPRQRTALMHAAERGHAEVVDLLLAAGAKVDLKDKGIGAELPGGNTALLIALRNKHTRIALRLLEAKADPQAASGGVSVLSQAASLGDPGLVRRLLDLGLAPNASGKSGDSPLASALHARQSEVARTLLGAGANPNTRGLHGVQPLEIAIRENLEEATRVLLRYGARPNDTSPAGLTPLMIAVLCGRREIAALLLENGARSDARSQAGQTALDLAREQLDEVSAAHPDSWRRESTAGPARWKVYHDLIKLLQEYSASAGDNAAAADGPLHPAAPPKGKLAAARLRREAAPAPLGMADFLELLRFGEPEFSVVAVQAPLEDAAALFCERNRPDAWHRDVPRRSGCILRPTRAWLVALVEITGNPWTVIYRSVFRLGPGELKLAADDAAALSAQLKTRTVSLAREQSGESIGYALFETGRPVEHARWREQGAICSFQSRSRRPPGKDESGEAFTDKVLRQLGIHVPACNPLCRQDDVWLNVEIISAPALQRADIMVLPRTGKARV